MLKFVQHFTEVYGNSPDSFVEENGRKLFLLYIRPLINGTGNYYIEARTRSMGRTDLIIDYLDDYQLETGYLLSFNFNKNKCPGVRKLHFKNHTIVEAVV